MGLVLHQVGDDALAVREEFDLGVHHIEEELRLPAIGSGPAFCSSVL
jgi:hypothetical protein